MKVNQVTSRLGFGCVALTNFKWSSHAVDFLKLVYDSGIIYYDTAPIYGGGYSERILGNFIRSQRRENLVVTTKFGLSVPAPKIPVFAALPLNNLRKQIMKPSPYRPAELAVPEVYPKRIIKLQEVLHSLENSLRNLRTDYIDNFLLHEGIPDFLTEEALNFLFEKKEEGVIGKLGIACNYVNIRTLQESALTDWDILQYENGALYNTKDILSSFPNKQHIYHSILRYTYLTDEAPVDISPEKKAGYILAKYLKENPKGMVLFSTGSKKNLSLNLSSIEEYS